MHQKSVKPGQIIPVFTHVCDHNRKSKREKSRRALQPNWFSGCPCAFPKILRGSMTKQLRATMAAILVFSTISLQAQTSTAATPKKTTTKKVVQKKAPVESSVEREIRELREQMQSQ